jgi:hypothetical protein
MGALDEQQDVVADAQMDVVDGLIDEADAIVAALRHPQRDIALRRPFAPANDQGLAEPVLPHAGQDRADRDEHEDDELALHRAPIARLQRVEEPAVPLIHLDRDIDHEQLGADDAGEQPARAPAVVRAEIGQREMEEGAQGSNDILHGASLDELAGHIGA